MRTEIYTYLKCLRLIPSISIDWRRINNRYKLCGIWITFEFLFWTIEIYLWEMADEEMIKYIVKGDGKKLNSRDR